MATVYATIDDLRLFRKLTPEAEEQAAELLSNASALIRTTAKRYHRDFDQMIADDPDLAIVAKQVTIRAVERALNDSKSNTSGVSQATQSAMGYSVSYTVPNPGRSLYLLKNELKDLGIRRQRYGIMEVYDHGDDQGD